MVYYLSRILGHTSIMLCININIFSILIGGAGILILEVMRWRGFCTELRYRIICLILMLSRPLSARKEENIKSLFIDLFNLIITKFI